VWRSIKPGSSHWPCRSLSFGEVAVRDDLGDPVLLDHEDILDDLGRRDDAGVGEDEWIGHVGEGGAYLRTPCGRRQASDGVGHPLHAGDEEDDEQNEREGVRIAQNLHRQLEFEADAAASVDSERDGGAKVDIEGIEGTAHHHRQHLGHDGVPDDLPASGTYEIHRLARSRLDLLDCVGEELPEHPDAAAIASAIMAANGP
jgi:hypothetical protein